jgi:hypothetical protein
VTTNEERYRFINESLIFLIGRQRSGTTPLRKELERQYDVIDVGEIFFSAPGSEDPNYFRFLRERLSSRAQDDYVVHEEPIFEEFLLTLALEARGQKIIADIKYASLGAVRTLNFYLERTAVTEIARRYGIPIIHITRSNKLDVIISEALAEKTGVWRIESADERDLVTKITLDPCRIFDQIQHEVALSTDAMKKIGLNNNVTNVFYERMFPHPDRVDQFGLELISRNVRLHARGGDSLRTIAVPLKQNVRPKSEVVENWHELVDVLGQTEFGWMLYELDF